jgi:hypothetical protein
MKARKRPQSPLPLRHLRRIVPARFLEEVADIDTERSSNSIQAPRGNASRPPLVFVRLLKGNPDQFGHLPPSQPEHNPASADARSDMPVDILRATPLLGINLLNHG